MTFHITYFIALRQSFSTQLPNNSHPVNSRIQIEIKENENGTYEIKWKHHTRTKTRSNKFGEICVLEMHSSNSKAGESQM